MAAHNATRRIHILRDADSHRIAAGEVIDRPLSVVRELIDNAIDAEATQIEVRIEDGGVRSIRVTDNGTGMSGQDLELCVLPHATSKISNAEDIYRVTSLGFRGEALSSIAACSKLEITSTSGENAERGSRIRVHGGHVLGVEECPGRPGTIVNVEDLFYALPGRRRFLKRTSTEASSCAASFIEKALPFPEITFRYFNEDKLKFFFQSTGYLQRVEQAFSKKLQGSKLFDVREEFDGYSIYLVGADPDYSRKDRRSIQIFVNNRRIEEFSFVQAVTYGYSEYMPGGRFPLACVFVRIDPSLVDFNIHPAKRQVRFRNLPDIHRSLSRLVANTLQPLARRYVQGNATRNPPFTPGKDADIGGLWKGGSGIDYGSNKPTSGPDEGRWTYVFESGEKQSNEGVWERNLAPLQASLGFRYLGQVFGLFLAVERDDHLYLIDQHAAHEKILYERLRVDSDNIQHLLVPLELELDQDQEQTLISELQALEDLGIKIEKQGEGRFAIISYPEVCSTMENLLVDFLSNMPTQRKSLDRDLYSDLACKAAIKEGEIVDGATAAELTKGAFNLSNAYCPHGRPVWYEISRSELLKLVGRE